MPVEFVQVWFCTISSCPTAIHKTSRWSTFHAASKFDRTVVLIQAIIWVNLINFRQFGKANIVSVYFYLRIFYRFRYRIRINNNFEHYSGNYWYAYPGYKFHAVTLTFDLLQCQLNLLQCWGRGTQISIFCNISIYHCKRLL